jgi:hypothetical protein
MVYRHELTEHFEWLAGSRIYDEVLDEVLVALAFVEHGHDEELVASGAAWMTAGGLVDFWGVR